MLKKLMAVVVLSAVLSGCGIPGYMATQKTVAELTAAETALLAGCANGGGNSGSTYRNTDGKTVEVAAKSNFTPEQCEKLWQRHFDVQAKKAERPIVVVPPQQTPGYQQNYYQPGSYAGTICFTGCKRETKTTTSTVNETVQTPTGSRSTSTTSTKTRTR